MIIEYHRPDRLEDALDLLSRSDPVTFPLGGGSVLNQPSDERFAVVDLQSLELSRINKKGNTLQLGATVTLQALANFSGIHSNLVKAIFHEATYNTRQVATIAGALIAADGRSPFGTAMLALGAKLSLLPGDKNLSLGDVFPFRREKLKGKLIVQITIPSNVELAYEYVSRTPADLPIVCMALAQWPSGRTRVALGGYGSSPILAMDGPHSDGAEIVVRDAFHEASDQWASSEYRSDIAATLVKRVLSTLN